MVDGVGEVVARLVEVEVVVRDACLVVGGGCVQGQAARTESARAGQVSSSTYLPEVRGPTHKAGQLTGQIGRHGAHRTVSSCMKFRISWAGRDDTRRQRGGIAPRSGRWCNSSVGLPWGLVISTSIDTVTGLWTKHG